MEQAKRKTHLHSEEAILWMGEHRIPGIFTVCEDAVEFLVEPDTGSHFTLYIPKINIRRIEEFLLFGVSRNGLSIKSRDGREDLFVVEDPGALKRLLVDWRGSKPRT